MGKQFNHSRLSDTSVIREYQALRRSISVDSIGGLQREFQVVELSVDYSRRAVLQLGRFTVLQPSMTDELTSFC